jgi:hypothetical protein
VTQPVDRLPTTLITKLLTNQLAQSRSTADCGGAPILASSGRTHRHRLNRGGDRSANNALYVVVLGRMRHDARTRAYVERRTHEGLAKPEIIRCLIGEVSVMRPGIGLDRGFSVVSGDGLVAEPL